ncbi:MAG: SufD family Fe-S cluster assembly protein, partial [Acidimicrobiales bacterium]|nr:SufD family Fe-S cluster assembly protein [Acidimicrobiales bacterium]
KLKYMRLQGLSNETNQVSLQVSEIGNDAHLESVAVSTGGAITRDRIDTFHEGSASSSFQGAITVGRGSACHDLRTKQDHSGRFSVSEMVSAVVLDDESESVTTGLVRMNHGAKKSSAKQTNRNLLLSDSAHAESVPNLDIEENDVRCDHASAVGPLSQEQLHYLESRGISEEVARALLVKGFQKSTLDKVTSRTIAKFATTWLEKNSAEESVN